MVVLVVALAPSGDRNIGFSPTYDRNRACAPARSNGQFFQTQREKTKHALARGGRQSGFVSELLSPFGGRRFRNGRRLFRSALDGFAEISEQTPAPKQGRIPSRAKNRIRVRKWGRIPTLKSGRIPVPKLGRIPTPKLGRVLRSHYDSFNKPKSGPISGPESGPVLGPESGPILGPESGPSSGPESGPISEPIPASFRGRKLTPKITASLICGAGFWFQNLGRGPAPQIGVVLIRGTAAKRYGA